LSLPCHHKVILIKVLRYSVTPWDIISYKSMFNCIYCVIWLYDRLEWVEVCLELVMCEFLDVEFCWAKLKLWDFRFYQNLVQWNCDIGFVNRWIVFKFCLDLSKICFYRLTVEILKIITFGLPLNKNGALSAILTEGNCAEQPKAALSPIPTEGNYAEQPKGALSEPYCRGGCAKPKFLR